MSPEEAGKLYEPAKAQRFVEYLEHVDHCIREGSKTQTKSITISRLGDQYKDILRDVGLHLKGKGWHVQLFEYTGGYSSGWQIRLFFEPQLAKQSTWNRWWSCEYWETL